jgi:hypothetical protein
MTIALVNSLEYVASLRVPDGTPISEEEISMSLAMADFLIDVSDPARLREFKQDPERFMAASNLSDGDKAALRHGKSGWIRLQAKMATDDPKLHADHGAVLASANASADLIEVDLMVEISNTTSDNVAEEGPEILFIDEGGQLFRALEVA